MILGSVPLPWRRYFHPRPFFYKTLQSQRLFEIRRFLPFALSVTWLGLCRSRCSSPPESYGPPVVEWTWVINTGPVTSVVVPSGPTVLLVRVLLGVFDDGPLGPSSTRVPEPPASGGVVLSVIDAKDPDTDTTYGDVMNGGHKPLIT